MKTRMNRSVLATLSLVATLLVAAPAFADGFVLVRNAKNAAAAKLSKAEARDVFTGKKKTLGSAVVQAVLGPADSASFHWLADSIFGVSESVLTSKIKQEVFKGEMAKPISASSDDETLKQVAGSEGAIGVVAADAKLPAGVSAVELAP